MKKKILLSSIALAGMLAFQSCSDSSDHADATSDSTVSAGNVDTSHHETDHNSNSGTQSADMMTAMNKSMGTMSMSGDFDFDFANTMKMHHQQAVDMSEMETSKGSDATVKGWAQNIVTAQKTEIDQLDKFISGYKKPTESKSGKEDHNELMEAMDKMMNDMKAMTMTGNTDKDFVMMMVTHHKSAIAMAKDELSHGKNLELKKMAQKIIQDQTKEMNTFQAWLDKNK